MPTDEVAASRTPTWRRPSQRCARPMATRRLTRGEFRRRDNRWSMPKEPLVALLRLLRDHPALRFDRARRLSQRWITSTWAASRASPRLPPDEPAHLRTVARASAGAGGRSRHRSVTALYPSANWPEREVYDMFGHQFRRPPRPDAHPDAGRLGGPPAPQGLPASAAEEVEFSFNHERHRRGAAANPRRNAKSAIGRTGQ